MKVRELIEKLKQVDPEWEAENTNSKTIWICEPGYEGKPGQRYGYVALYDKPIRFLTVRERKKDKRRLQTFMSSA
jgi:hypothetical protein